MSEKKPEKELNQKASCHSCVHCRICALYLYFAEHRELGVFFHNYHFYSIAIICDNYQESGILIPLDLFKAIELFMNDLKNENFKKPETIPHFANDFLKKLKELKKIE